MNLIPGKSFRHLPTPNSTEQCWLCARDTEMTVPTVRLPSPDNKYNMVITALENRKCPMGPQRGRYHLFPGTPKAA